MILYARAKINWGLDVVGKRSDGYHELDTLMQSIDLYDTVRIEKRKKITVHCPGVDGVNLAEKAARLFFEETGLQGGASIWIEKRIPMQAGLGGGSADAAAVLVGLDRIYKTDLGDKLLEMGAKIGADGPFCIKGGIARAKGIGEKLEHLPEGKKYRLVLVKPHRGLLTKEVFHFFDTAGGKKPDIATLMKGVCTHNMDLIRQGIDNALHRAGQRLCPEIDRAYDILYSMGAKAVCMTGSGPTVFGIVEEGTPVRQRVEGFQMIYTDTAFQGVEVVG